jgi:hypothetical protein
MIASFNGRGIRNIQISTCLGHQGPREPHKHPPTRQTIYQPDIRLKNTPEIPKNVGQMKQNTNKCYRFYLYLMPF